MLPCNRIYYSKIYWRLNMFRAAHRSSSGALNCICSLWFACPCGDLPLRRLNGKWMYGSMNIKFIKKKKVNFLCLEACFIGIVTALGQLEVLYPLNNCLCDFCSFCVGNSGQNAASCLKDAISVRCSFFTSSLVVTREVTVHVSPHNFAFELTGVLLLIQVSKLCNSELPN